jgi:glycosyltransferase involved in cell wall biosynthesis
MACGLPCVVTDVGDCAYLVGGAGAVVPPRNPDRLASALVQMIRGGPALRRRLGLLARCRVEQLFGLDRTAASYMAAYRDAIRSRRAPAGLPAPPIAAGSASPNRSA